MTLCSCSLDFNIDCSFFFRKSDECIHIGNCRGSFDKKGGKIIEVSCMFVQDRECCVQLYYLYSFMLTVLWECWYI